MLNEYREYISKEEAEHTLAILNENNIPFQFVKLIDVFIPSYVPDIKLSNFVLKINEKDFAKVDKILSAIDQEELKTIPKDYYLYTFSDKELLEIIKNKDEWGEIDFQLARNILAEKGQEISEEQIEKWESQKIKELSKTDKNGIWYVGLGYIFVVFIGILGIIVGYVLKSAGRKLPNHKYAFSFSKEIRMHGEIIFYLSIVHVLINLYHLTKYELVQMYLFQ